MRVNVLTGEYYIIPREEWDKKKRKAIVLFKEDWIAIKKSLYSACIQFKCNHELDLISGAFESLDEAVGKIDGLLP